MGHIVKKITYICKLCVYMSACKMFGAYELKPPEESGLKHY